jgi:hypothetical protein
MSSSLIQSASKRAHDTSFVATIEVAGVTIKLDKVRVATTPTCTYLLLPFGGGVMLGKNDFDDFYTVVDDDTVKTHYKDAHVLFTADPKEAQLIRLQAELESQKSANAENVKRLQELEAELAAEDGDAQ